ncbi:MAG: hypothetical protein CG439_1702 [Methylococcaceae bacterium NSP1-2]|nr:MAG: hypothetical protein CG439_1702 [Methylococcaceae bacterium NSP1-2]
MQTLLILDTSDHKLQTLMYFQLIEYKGIYIYNR